MIGGIQEFKEKLSERLLEKHGLFRSEAYDLGLQVLINQENIELSDDVYIRGDITIDQYWYLKQAVLNVLMSVDPEIKELSFMKINIKIQEICGPYEDTYGLIVEIPSKKDILACASPIWVYNNHEFLVKFMSDNYEPYKKLLRLKNKINDKFSKL